jgi:hypothetical protein
MTLLQSKNGNECGEKGKQKFPTTQKITGEKSKKRF